VVGAPPLVCLPGGPGRAADYLGDLGGLSAHRQLVLLDNRGTGASATPAAPRPAPSALPGPPPCDQERGGADCHGASGEERQRQQVRGSGERQLALLGAD